MGFLETRSLDFDRIIMLSMNEGKFPKNTAPQSIIPYKLRKSFGLPAIEYQDSIFAYYFYRLLQCAKDLKILYSAQAQDGIGEASRFISQLKYELKKSESTTIAYKIKSLNISDLKVSKNSRILSQIKENMHRGMSPTAVNTYLNCPMMFYFKYIEKIQKPDKTEDRDDAAFFGTVYHDSMKRIYQNFTGKVLKIEDFKELSNKEFIKQKVEEAIEQEIPGAANNTIENQDSIISEVIQKYVKLSLEYDKKQVPFTITNLEEKFNFESGEKNREDGFFFKISGIIDRVDLKDGVYRVLDYKTGRVFSKINSFDDIFAPGRKNELNSVTQVLLYALMYAGNNNIKVCPGLLSISEIITNPGYKISINKTEFDGFTADTHKEFVNLLTDKLKEIANPDIDFLQTETIDNCKYCDYKLICMK